MTNKTVLNTEYRITERSYNEDWWYPHGGYFFDEEKARERHREMTDHYGKYGRTFRIESRLIQAWPDGTFKSLSSE